MNISLIIPVKNEEKAVGPLLVSIMAQTLVPEEIVITDGGSTDNTVRAIEDYIKKGFPIKMVRTDDAFPGKGRNLAIEASGNELIAMTDAGITLDKNWLEELAQMFSADPDLKVAYGSYEPVTDSLFKECFALLALSAPVSLGGRWTRTYFVASSMIKKDVWRSVGGFPDLRSAEDKIFMDRIKQKHFKTTVNPKAIVHWNLPGDFLQVFKKVSLYSMHDLIAGRFNDWHRSVTLMYLAGLVFFMLGFAFSPAWFFILVFCALARSALILVKKSPGRLLPYFLDLRRFALLTALMFWIDIAMFYGIVCYVGKKWRLGWHK
ncbi:MAG: glycosyltransferase [Candidatus Omnitrophica bacterium]|nr:glycosyltransferase [Candidatus Omnitrophota bacterium]